MDIRILEPDDQGRHCLVIMDSDEATFQLFDSLELQGGGYTWEAIARALLELDAPDLKPVVDIHAEGDEMYAYSADLTQLLRLEALIRKAADDHKLLRAAIERAGDDLE